MKKLLREFKTFISRGSVVDLAVGMIIGAAFTAIVTALVNHIFQPLINAIPMGDINGLITMIVAKDADGNVIPPEATGVVPDMTKSVYIDWGAFIMAVINFLLTAIVLFVIVKIINGVRENAERYKGIVITKEQRKELRAQGMSRIQMYEYVKKQQEEEAARAAAEAAAEAERNKPETTEQILNDIRELLKKQ